LDRYTRDEVVVLMHHYGPPFLVAGETPVATSMYKDTYLNRLIYYRWSSSLNKMLDMNCMVLFVDGKCPDWNELTTKLMAQQPWAQTFYNDVTSTIDADLQQPPEAHLTLNAHADGAGHVAVKVGVDSLKSSGAPDLRLHIVLVEDSLQFAGTNHRLLHRMMWRAAVDPLGPQNGQRLSSAPSTISAQFDVGQVSNDLHELNERERERMARNAEAPPKPYDPAIYQLNPKRLAVVVFVQDHSTGHVLQAAYQHL
jgi:hypothetical protein